MAVTRARVTTVYQHFVWSEVKEALPRWSANTSPNEEQGRAISISIEGVEEVVEKGTWLETVIGSMEDSTRTVEKVKREGNVCGEAGAMGQVTGNQGKLDGQTCRAPGDGVSMPPTKP